LRFKSFEIAEVDFVGGVKHFPKSAIHTRIEKKPKGSNKAWGLAVTPRFLKDQVLL
jgi:hypothetical protein